MIIASIAAGHQGAQHQPVTLADDEREALYDFFRLSTCEVDDPAPGISAP